MPSIRTVAFALALALAPGFAFAQQPAPAAADQPPIEQRMTPEQFQAAGLGKLTPQELANLNAWLRGTLQAETTRAAAAATEKVKEDNRGFFHFGSDEAVTARIVGEFDGFRRGRKYTLDNGQVWLQTDGAKLEGVHLTNPEVNIRPRIFGNVWQMTVGRYNTRAEVERIK